MDEGSDTGGYHGGLDKPYDFCLANWSAVMFSDRSYDSDRRNIANEHANDVLEGEE